MATTINTYSVGLTLDAADYINKSALSAQETRRLSRAIEEARSPAERYSMTQDRLGKALAKGGIDQATHNRLLDVAKTKLEAAARANDRATQSQTKSNAAITSGISSLKNLAAAYIGFGTIKKSISLAIDAEQASAAFEVLTGSIESSVMLLDELRSLSDATPLSTTGVRDAARTMLSFNIPLVQVMDNLRMLSDISQGNEARFDSLTLAFSQASAAGRLMGQDVLQMINAGFNPLQEISRKTGESMIELKKRMEDGAISSNEVRDAFMSATSEGGKFFGMSEKLAGTMGGKLAIAMGDVEKAGIKIGEAFAPLVIDLTEGFDKGISKVHVFVGLVEALVDGLRFANAAASDQIELYKSLASATVPDDMLKNTNALLDEIEKRDRKRKEDLEAEAYKRMNPATLDPTSPEFKARVEAENKAREEAVRRSESASVGVIASAISEGFLESRNVQSQQTDLLVPTPGELLITGAVDKAVEAIRENKFSRIR